MNAMNSKSEDNQINNFYSKKKLVNSIKFNWKLGRNLWFNF
jgi:hypothetical protein